MRSEVISESNTQNLESTLRSNGNRTARITYEIDFGQTMTDIAVQWDWGLFGGGTDDRKAIMHIRDTADNYLASIYKTSDDYASGWVGGVETYDITGEYSTLRVELIVDPDSTDTNYAKVKDLMVTAGEVVPEPTTMALLLAGGLFGVIRRRR